MGSRESNVPLLSVGYVPADDDHQARSIRTLVTFLFALFLSRRVR